MAFCRIVTYTIHLLFYILCCNAGHKKNNDTADLLIDDTIANLFNVASKKEKYGVFDEMYNEGLVSKKEIEMGWFDDVGWTEKYEDQMAYTTLRSIKDNYRMWNHNSKIGTSHHGWYTQEQRSFYRLQDLGNDGTPAICFYPKIRRNICDTTGYDVFDVYKKDLMSYKIYDTKAPCTCVNVVFANGKGHIFNSEFAYSLNRNLHFKLSYNEKQLDKEWGHKKSGDDLHVLNRDLMFSGVYTNNGHTALLCLLRRSTNINEFGGIIGNGGNYYCTRLGDRYHTNIDNDDSSLTKELVYNVIAYYQYKINHFVQPYLEYDLRFESHSFELGACKSTEHVGGLEYVRSGKNLGLCTIQYLFGDYKCDYNRSGYFPFVNDDRFLLNSLEVGTKGNINKSVFYRIYNRFYWSNRNFVNYLVKNKVGTMVGYIPVINDRNGGHVHVPYKNFSNVVGAVVRAYKFFVSGEISMLDGTHRLEYGYRCKYFNIIANHAVYRVPLIFRQYLSTYTGLTEFVTNMLSPSITQVEASANIGSSKLGIKPFVSFSWTRNGLFFIEKENDYDHIDNPSIQCEPCQNTRNIGLFSGGGNMYVHTSKGFYIDVNIMINKKVYINDVTGNNERLDNVPLLIANGNLYWERVISGRAKLTIGTELTYRSAFMGDKYNPVIQQFYNQKEYVLDNGGGQPMKVHESFEIDSRIYINPYIYYTVERFKFFITVFNMIHLFTNKNNYASPFYPEPNFTYNFGVEYVCFN